MQKFSSVICHIQDLSISLKKYSIVLIIILGTGIGIGPEIPYP